MWELARIAQSRPCPDCDASAPGPCVSLRGTRGDTIAVPHASRYPAGNRRIGDPTNAAALERSRHVL